MDEPHPSLNTRTPGYEVNDMAFQARADFIAGLANVTRLFNQQTRLYRRLSITGGGQYERNYQGLMVGTPQGTSRSTASRRGSGA